MATATAERTTDLTDGLGPDGLKLWNAATEGRTFSKTQLLMLRSEADFTDLASPARATVAREGPTRTSRYHGARRHPAAEQAVRFAREARTILTRLRVWI